MKSQPIAPCSPLASGALAPAMTGNGRCLATTSLMRSVAGGTARPATDASVVMFMRLPPAESELRQRSRTQHTLRAAVYRALTPPRRAECPPAFGALTKALRRDPYLPCFVVSWMRVGPPSWFATITLWSPSLLACSSANVPTVLSPLVRIPPLNDAGRCDLYHSATFFASSFVVYTFISSEPVLVVIDISPSLLSAAPG